MTVRSKSSSLPRAAAAQGAKPARAGVKPALRSDAAVKRAVSGEMSKVVERISPWAGGPRQALAWCEEVGIPALGGLTAEQLIRQGQAKSVMAYLDHIAVGGFA